MLYSGYYTKLLTAQLSHFSCFLLKGFVWTQLYNWDIQVPCLDGYLYDPRIPLDLCAGITQSPWTWLAHHCVWWFGEYTVYQWQYCTSYCMIYFLYEVNCGFLSILLHKYLTLCFFTSYCREITIQKYFSYLVSFSSQMNWFLTIPIIFSLYSDSCMPKTNGNVTSKRKSTS